MTKKTAIALYVTLLTILTRQTALASNQRFDMQTPNPSPTIVTPKYPVNNLCNSASWVNMGWTPCMVMASGTLTPSEQVVYLTGNSGYQQWVLQYSSGVLAYAERTHYIKSTHIKREFITQYTHKVELIASCKSGLEYYNQMRYIKPINKQYYSARVMPIGWKVRWDNSKLAKPYKVQCMFIKSNDRI